MKKKNKYEDSSFFVVEDNQNISSGITAPHTLTPEELLGEKDSKEIINESHNALEALKKRMTLSHQKLKKESIIDESFTISSEEKVYIEKIDKTIGLDVENSSGEEVSTPQKEETPTSDVSVSTKSLLDRCSAFLVEEDGSKANTAKEPLYKLQSVADILKSDGEKFIEKLSEDYDVWFDDLKISPESTINEPPKETPKEFPKETPVKVAPTPKKPITPVIKQEEKKNEAPKKEKKSSFEDIIFISDIDTPTGETKKPKTENVANDSVITFTPSPKKEDGTKINISTQTRAFDLTGELAKLPTDSDSDTNDQVQLEKDDFEDFIPETEVDFEKNANSFIRKYSLQKRNSFICTVFSFLITAILCLGFIPFINDFGHTDFLVYSIISSSLALITVALNLDCFKSLSKIFLKSSGPDVTTVLSVLFITLYTVFGILDRVSVWEIHLLLCGILSFRSFGKFMKISHILSGLKISASPNPKNTLKLINDNAICLTMAEGSVEGDVLVADTQKANNISDFMKYTTYGNYIDGKFPIITILSAALSIITGFACGIYFDGIVYGFYAAAIIQCFASLPIAFMIDNLPLYRASKKLSISGGMILGKKGAEYAETANAAVISADRLFPPGTVTLHQMQALSANNLEDTIVRAASLTECLGSTLAPIFKGIAGTSDITALPDSDTVKYEDKMGISGWVDNRLMFIGNRTLLETHGIPAPSLEVDRKILREGFFPVYVADQNRAYALIVVRYDVNRDVMSELRTLTNSGVNLLISSCDPNLTEEMICDYFGLYSDSVKVMSAAGRHLHKNTTAPVKTASVPAICGRSHIGIASILNCAAKIKSLNLWFTVLYILSMISGILIFSYTSFAGSGTLLSGLSALLYSALSTVFSFLIYFIKRP